VDQIAHQVYIGIGSNLGSPRKNCEDAINAIKELPEIVLKASSSFYKTEPLGIEDQNWFINSTILIETSLEPSKLLDCLLAIEEKMGRIRKKKWGPRVIDLDILFYDNLILDRPKLKIPHPELTHRRFVLAPLAEIAKDFIHPQENKSVGILLKELKDNNKVNLLLESN
jgi:2-amino-4-hydroxy-6-hydroxymethyldihydropteridine diphosphokinase